MTVFDIAHRRLLSQLLSDSKVKTPADVVRHLGGIQAQDYAGGEWSIGLRSPGSTISDVERAIAEGKIVRTWAMRGTLHFLAGPDTRWILELLAPSMIAGLVRRYKELGLDASTLKKTNSILAKALKGNKQLTRDELKTVIEKNGVSCEGQRAVFILHRASIDRVICFGVTRGKQQTHARFEEWVPKGKTMIREESLAELTRRYFMSHGPATTQDFMWWSGLQASDAKTGLELVKPELTQVTIEGKAYWMPLKTPPLKSTAPIAHLLPPFDGYLLGYKDRGAPIDSTASGKMRTGGMPSPAIVIDGQVTGTWTRAFEKDNIVVETNKFRKLNKREEQALEDVVERYAEFIGKSAVLAQNGA